MNDILFISDSETRELGVTIDIVDFTHSLGNIT